MAAQGYNPGCWRGTPNDEKGERRGKGEAPGPCQSNRHIQVEPEGPGA